MKNGLVPTSYHGATYVGTRYMQGLEGIWKRLDLSSSFSPIEESKKDREKSYMRLELLMAKENPIRKVF